MSVGRIIAGVTLTLSLANAPGHAAPDGITLTPVAVELPDGDDAFPPGPGAELVAGNCVACHSSGMILSQPALTKATWAAEVTKMRNTYKAPVADEDVAAIVDYLAAMPVAR